MQLFAETEPDAQDDELREQKHLTVDDGRYLACDWGARPAGESEYFPATPRRS